MKTIKAIAKAFLNFITSLLAILVTLLATVGPLLPKTWEKTIKNIEEYLYKAGRSLKELEEENE